MSWIRTVPEAEASGRLKDLYERLRGPGGRVDNIMAAHSLRPHGIEGHMALYRAVLHHCDNRLPDWLLETIGVYVSLLNGCAYCVAHHAAGLARLLGDEERAEAIREALAAGEPERALGARECAALAYARALTLAPAEIDQAAIGRLHEAGFDDGEILEINQVAAYFAYANRTVLGLGVDSEGEVLGLSPSEDDWAHR